MMKVFKLLRRLITKCCLKSTYTLRRQLIESYGSIAFVSIGIVVIFGIILVMHSGNLVKDIARIGLTYQVSSKLHVINKHAAFVLTEKLRFYRGTSTLLSELVRDRIVGYNGSITNYYDHTTTNIDNNNTMSTTTSTFDDFITDRHVPFYDVDSKRNVYPLNSKLLPNDWNFETHETLEEFIECFGIERTIYFMKNHHLHHHDANNSHNNSNNHDAEYHQAIMLTDDEDSIPIKSVSMKSPMYTFPGNCDPTLSIRSISSSKKYYPNCTTANSNLTTGGVIRPVPTTKYLGMKSADIGVFLKPLYESIPESLSISIQYHNSGAGSILQIPASIIAYNDTYTSVGCEWANEHINPYTNNPFSTIEEISHCVPTSQQQQQQQQVVVSKRNYNPLEHPLCQNQVLNYSKIPIYGPYQDYNTKEWVLSVGVAIFDRLTGYFIACSSIEIIVDTLFNELSNSIGTNETDLSLVRFDDGRIVTGAGWDRTTTTNDDDNDTAAATSTPPYVWETGFMDQTTFERMTSIVNWDEEWDPNEIFELLQAGLSDNYFVDNTGTNRNSFFAYPVPVPPKQYDPMYRPEFLLILSRFEEVYDVIDSIDESIDDDVSNLIVLTVSIGLIGLTVLTITILCVSMMVTRPLDWMKTITWQIVNHNDTRTIDIPEPKQSRYQTTTQTETAILVDEFRTMIRGFSGNGASTVARANRLVEIRNMFSYHDAFASLYSTPEGSNYDLPAFSRIPDQSGLGASQEEVDQKTSGSESHDKEECTELTENDTISERPSIYRAASVDVFPPKVNKGLCAVQLSSPSHRSDDDGLLEGDEDKGIHRSRLFLCIAALIVLPLLLTNIFICGMVAYNISEVLPSWTGDSKSTSLYVEEASLTSTAQLVASYAEAAMVDYMRDLHLITRTSGWLLFGAIARSTSFSDYDAFVQACRGYSPREGPVCPFGSPCTCDDAKFSDDRECTLQTRSPQQPYFALQDTDADPLTGNRNESSSYPAHSTTADTTSWYTNASDVPGSHKGVNASGWETTYDRIRVMSALATVLVPIYNNDVEEHDRSHIERTGYFAFEDDGLFIGYAGCEYVFSQSPAFQAAEWNGAHLIRPELCPEGKFGYDPRCRGWYETGVKTAMELNQPAYVTEPYEFSVGGLFGGSAGSAIFDPATGKLIGQTLLDFSPTRLVEHLSNWSDASVLFTFVIVPGEDEENTLIGPGHSIGDDPMAIDDVVLPHDDLSSANRREFAGITKRMKEAEQGDEYFHRTGPDGVRELIRLSFAPVFARTLKPVAPDDFDRGFSVSNVHLYSIGVASLDETLREPVLAIQERVNSSVTVMKWLSFLVVFILCFLVVVFVSLISVQVTKPMVILLRIVRNVNKGRIGDTIPPLEGGSREVHQVYNSFSKLYKIVHVSNTAYFSGNLKWAHHIQTNALQLFRKVNDEKAVAIATNNLANILFAINREANVSPSLCHEVDSTCYIKAALGLLDESISMGTREFDNGHDDELMAGLAQQLADRHFNRSLILLHSVGHPCVPPEAQQMGYSDLVKAKMFDANVGNYWMAKKLMLKNSAIRYERRIRRIHGLALLRMVDRAVDEIWNATEVVQEAEAILLAAWDQPTAPLFADVSKIGRLQQLEGAAVCLDLSAGRVLDAARCGIRMLVEDEYIIASSFSIVSDALLRFTGAPPSWPDEAIASCRGDIRSMLKSLSRNASFKSVIFCIDLSGDKSESMLDCIKASCLTLYDFHCGPDDFVGVVGAGVAGRHELINAFGKKQGSTNQRNLIDEAFQSTGERTTPPVLSLATQVLADNGSRSRGSDVFVVFVTDRVPGDENSLSLTKQRLEQLNVSDYSSINMLVVGLESEVPEFGGQFRELTNISQASEYFPITSGDDVSGAFERISQVFASRRLGMLRDKIHLALTMEKF